MNKCNNFTLNWILMIAFLDSQTTYTLLGTILIVIFSANLILLFACSCIYEFINLFKHCKDKRKQTRTEMKYVTPKITQRVELKRRKLSDACPKQEGLEKYEKLEKSANNSENTTNKIKSINESDKANHEMKEEYHPLDNIYDKNKVNLDDEYNMPKSSVFYCPPLEIKKNVDPMMLKDLSCI